MKKIIGEIFIKEHLLNMILAKSEKYSLEKKFWDDPQSNSLYHEFMIHFSPDVLYSLFYPLRDGDRPNLFVLKKSDLTPTERDIISMNGSSILNALEYSREYYKNSDYDP